MNIDDEHQLDFESDYRSSQGVDLEQIKNQNKSQHKKKKKRNQKGRNEEFIQRYAIQFFTVFMPTNCQILQYFWLHENMEDGFSKNFSLIFMILNYIMCLVTYYQCVNITNMPNDTAAQVSTTNQIVELESTKQNNSCEDCKRVKPYRSHHCSSCERCSLKMDHHCPWITNCVGYRNHRAFLLFNYYMAMGATQYCYRSLSYFLYLINSANFWQNSWFFYVYFVFTNTVLVPITTMLIGLVFFHSLLAITNSTTLEGLRTGGAPPMPCVDIKIGPYLQIQAANINNKGIYANLAEYFQYDRFFFWWPTENIGKSDGTYKPVYPPVTLHQELELRQILKEQKQKYQQLTYQQERLQEEEQQIQQQQIDEKIVLDGALDINFELERYEKMIIEQQTKYADKKFQFGEKFFELWNQFEVDPNKIGINVEILEKQANLFLQQQQNDISVENSEIIQLQNNEEKAEILNSEENLNENNQQSFI